MTLSFVLMLCTWWLLNNIATNNIAVNNISFYNNLVTYEEVFEEITLMYLNKITIPDNAFYNAHNTVIPVFLKR